ncbi:hypothetical protein N868_08275 [Cellulomonas carbonis T26]|uniref:Lipoprotein n=1 Tax=Cellulomonas carbonis T26 TaxID=947969 RepID=A0A0A0BUQ5_9CELL|nr:hypothetical protein N868_08275 [Cellulomonas carbonis T26]
MPSRIAPALLAPAVLVGVLAGCSTEVPEPAPTTPAVEAEPSPTPSPTPTADPAVVADVLEVHSAFWDAVIASENGPDPDAAPFFAIASEEVTGQQVGRVAQYLDIGMKRSGAPELGEPVVTVDGTTARVEQCVNQDPWVAIGPDGTEVAADDGVLPQGWELTEADGSWKVTRLFGAQETEIQC